MLVEGWALAQYPYLIPPDLTVHGAAAPAVTLRLVASPAHWTHLEGTNR